MLVDDVMDWFLLPLAGGVFSTKSSLELEPPPFRFFFEVALVDF